MEHFTKVKGLEWVKTICHKSHCIINIQIYLENMIGQKNVHLEIFILNNFLSNIKICIANVIFLFLYFGWGLSTPGYVVTIMLCPFFQSVSKKLHVIFSDFLSVKLFFLTFEVTRDT